MSMYVNNRKSKYDTLDESLFWRFSVLYKELRQHQDQLRRSAVFIVNLEQISHIILVFPLLTLKK